MTAKSPAKPAPATEFAPFANESDALSLGELNVENHTDHVAIFGNLDIPRDAEGLRQAKALHALLSRVVEELEAPGGLQADGDAEAPAAPRQVDNPFGG